MRLVQIALFISCAFCSSQNQTHSQPSLPDFPGMQLKAEIARIEPLLAWKDGWPCAMDGFCSNGDGFVNAGEISTEGDWPSDLEAAAFASVGPNGKPYRSASHQANPTMDESPRFSRDQALGLLLLAQSYPSVQELAQRVRGYVDGNDGLLCQNIGTCFVTPALRIEWKLALGESVTKAERVVWEQTLLRSAESAPAGFQQHLISLDVWLTIRANKNSSTIRQVASTLHDRMKNNLWFATLKQMAHAESDFVNTGILLLDCMRQWQRPGLHHTWSSSREGSVCETRSEGAMGHELVWLAKVLTSDEVCKGAYGSISEEE